MYLDLFVFIFFSHIKQVMGNILFFNYKLNMSIYFSRIILRKYNDTFLIISVEFSSTTLKDWFIRTMEIENEKKLVIGTFTLNYQIGITDLLLSRSKIFRICLSYLILKIRLKLLWSLEFASDQTYLILKMTRWVFLWLSGNMTN